MELQSATIDGNIIRKSIYDSVTVAREEILRPTKIFKYGPFKRKKVYRETIEAYEKQFVISFLFQTYLSITIPLEELVEMRTFLEHYGLTLIANSVDNEIECRLHSALYQNDTRLFFEIRISALSTYLKVLKTLGNTNIPMIAASHDGLSFRIYAPDVFATLK